MTNAEINLAIARIEYPDGSYPQFDTPVSGLAVDYCDSWSDIGPIIERELIHLYPQIKDWIAECYGESDVEAYADTPTKAAALCYLKMKGVE